MLLDRVGSMATGVLAARSEFKLKDKQVSGLNWLLDIVDDYREAIDSLTPQSRPSPSPAVTFAPQNASFYNIDHMAEKGQAMWQQIATNQNGLESLFWASLMLSASSWSRVIRGQVKLGGPQNLLEPEILSEAEAKSKVVLSAREIAYAIETVSPATKPQTAPRKTLEDRLAFWTRLSNNLSKELRAAGHPVPQPMAVYDLTPAQSDAAALATLGQVESRSGEHLGRWLTAAPDAEQRARVLRIMSKTTQSALDLGAPALRWPGWPA